MNVKGQGHSLTLVQGRSDSTLRPIEVKFYAEPPLDRAMKMSSNGLCHMSKMTAMPMVKTLKNLLLWNQKADDLRLGMQYLVLDYYQVCSNDDPVLTYFTARPNLVPIVWVNT